MTTRKNFKVVRELYAGVRYRYFLFWDGTPRAVGRLKMLRGRFQNLAIIALAADAEGSDLDIEPLGRLGYAGEGVEVELFGPAAYQTIHQLDNTTMAADWIISHRDEFLPAGMVETDFSWDYQEYSHEHAHYLALAAAQNAGIAAASDCLTRKDLRINAVGPLLGFSLEIFGIDQLLRQSDFPLPIPGIKTQLAATDRGLILLSLPDPTTSSTISVDINRDQPPEAEALYFNQSAPDLLGKFHGLACRYFRKLVVATLSLLLLASVGSAVISIPEARQQEMLQELKFLQANLARVEEQIGDMKKEYAALCLREGQRTRMADYLNALARAKPDQIWWRKISLGQDGGFSLEGFAVGQKAATGYLHALKSLPFLPGTEMAKLAKYTPAVDSPIPGKFAGELFVFKLDLVGVR